MKYILSFFVAVFALVLFTPAVAQVGPGHWAAWDKYERGTTTRTRTVRRAYTQRRSVRQVRVSKRHTRMATVTPAVAKRIPTGEGTLPTPFGVATRTQGSLVGAPSSIQSFLAAVQSQCGSVKVISGHRPGARVAGSGVISCHATGQAVDYTTSNPACALRVAAGFRNLGHSTDYGRVAHYHVSSCAREAGARFAHYTGGSRYARASTRRYASTQGTRRARSTRVRTARVAQARLPARARPTAGGWDSSW